MKLSRYPNVHYKILTENIRPWRRALIVTAKLLGVACLLAFLSITTLHLYRARSGKRFEPATLNAKTGEASLGLVRGPKITVPEIPLSFKTIGLIFYGRRSRVEILDCYLKQNLVENGGSLDQVVFVVKTTDVEDLKWLDQLVNTSDSYARFDLPNINVNFGQVWDIFERGTMYVKIDDDVVFIGNSTVSRLVAAKSGHPEYLLVSANGINNPALSWVHYHLGAILPYLPELIPPKPSKVASWRASELPLWDGDPSFDRLEWFDPPYENHRWLPLGPEYTLDGTPITKTTYDKSGPGWSNWAIAAQEHYSFLDNLERDRLEKYHFDTWDYQYERLSINMIAIWGDDVVDNRPFPEDDEQWLTVDLPKKLGRHAMMDGKAVASHYAFQAQRIDGKGLEWTDLLFRYKAYADENVCKSF